MGKKQVKEKKSLADSNASAGKNEKVSVPNEPEAQTESEIVLRKKENAAKLAKVLKTVHAQVVSAVEVKQVSAAVKALQAFTKVKKAASVNIVQDQDDALVLTFTLTRVPKKPSARPF